MALFPDDNPTHAAYLLSNGQLWVQKYNQYVEPPFYCMDHVLLTNPNVNASSVPDARQQTVLRNVTLTCYPDEQPAWQLALKTGCLIVSSIFLALTLLISVLLPDSSWLGNWTLLSYVGSLLAGSLMLITIFFYHDEIDGTCCVVFGECSDVEGTHTGVHHKRP
jgi:hypothetical protein